MPPFIDFKDSGEGSDEKSLQWLLFPYGQESGGERVTVQVRRRIHAPRVPILDWEWVTGEF